MSGTHLSRNFALAATVSLGLAASALAADEPKWEHVDATYELAEAGFVAADQGRSQSDRYLLASGDYSDFVITWRMRKRSDVTGRPRAIVVFGVGPEIKKHRRSFFLAGHCRDVGQWHSFRLVVLAGAAVLSKDGQTVSRRPSDYGQPRRPGRVGFLHYYNYDYEYAQVQLIPLDSGTAASPIHASAALLPTGAVRLQWQVRPELAGLVKFAISRETRGQRAVIGETNTCEHIDRDTAAGEAYTYHISSVTASAQRIGTPTTASITIAALPGPEPPGHVAALRRIDGSVRVSWRLSPFGRAHSLTVLTGEKPIRSPDDGRVVARDVPCGEAAYLDRSGNPGRHYAVVVAARQDKRIALRHTQVTTSAPAVGPNRSWPAKHPYLLFTTADLARVNARAARDPGAKKRLDHIVQQARSRASKTFVVHPKDDPKHRSAPGGLRAVALGYALSGDETLAQWVRDGLLGYAALYRTLPVVYGSRKLFPVSSLYEATWYVPIVLAYDLVCESPSFSQAQRQQIERDLLRPAAALFKIDDFHSDPRIRDLHFRCYNFQAWHLAAVGLTGLCLRDADMVEWTIDSPYGFKHLVSHDIRDDGLFWERSLGYHHFVLSALSPLLEAAWHCNLDLYHLSVPDTITKDEDGCYVVDGDNGPKTLKLMYDAPFHYMFPDMTFGVVADSSRGPLRADHRFRIAWARYRDPKYAWLLSRKSRPAPPLWRGLSDLTGRVQLAWDQERLYVWADVTDDVVRNTHKQPDKCWQGDLVWLGLKFTKTRAGEYDFIYALVPGDLHDVKPRLVLFNRYCETVGQVSRGQIALRAKPGGYCIEAAIPFSEMAPEPGEAHEPFRPTGSVGFEVCLYDGDRTRGASIKEKMLGWSSTTDRYDTSQGGRLLFSSPDPAAPGTGPSVCVARQVQRPLAIDGTSTDWPEAGQGEAAVVHDERRLTTDASSAIASDIYSLVYGHPGHQDYRFSIGTGTFANVGQARAGSTLFPSSGFAILRSPGCAEWVAGEPAKNKDGTCVLLNYGPHGGGHGHPDKLSIIVYGSGRHAIPDFGSAKYGSDLKRQWTSHTLSHNTIVVDQTSQWPAGSSDVSWPCDNPDRKAMGRLAAFFSDDVLKLASASCDAVYRGVTLTRTVALVDEFVLDVFHAKSAKEHVYDYVLHVDGKLSNSGGQAMDRLGDQCGYQHLTDAARVAEALPWRGAWQTPGPPLAIRLLGKTPAEVIRAYGPTKTVDKKMAILLVRRRGREATFVSVIEPRPAVSGLGRAEADTTAHNATVTGRRGEYWFAWSGDQPRFHGLFACVKTAPGIVSLSLVKARRIAAGGMRFECSAPVDATMALRGARCELRVHAGSGRVVLAAPLPAAARVLRVQGQGTVPVPFERANGRWQFTVQPGEYRLAEPR